MAIKRVSTIGDGVALELSAAEYATIERALLKALERAREVGALADEADTVRLLNDLHIPVAHAALEAGQEVTRLREALERVLATARTFKAAAESPAEAVPFYELGAIALMALSTPGEQLPED